MWWGIVPCKLYSTLILWVYLRIYLICIISESGSETSQINKYKWYHKTTVFWPREVCHLCCHLVLCYSLPATYVSSPPGSTQQLHRNSEGSYQCGMRPGHLWQCECGSFHIYKCKSGFLIHLSTIVPYSGFKLLCTLQQNMDGRTSLRWSWFLESTSIYSTRCNFLLSHLGVDNIYHI